MSRCKRATAKKLQATRIEKSKATQGRSHKRPPYPPRGRVALMRQADQIHSQFAVGHTHQVGGQALKCLARPTYTAQKQHPQIYRAPHAPFQDKLGNKASRKTCFLFMETCCKTPHGVQIDYAKSRSTHGRQANDALCRRHQCFSLHVAPARPRLLPPCFESAKTLCTVRSAFFRISILPPCPKSPEGYHTL